MYKLYWCAQTAAFGPQAVLEAVTVAKALAFLAQRPPVCPFVLLRLRVWSWRSQGGSARDTTGVKQWLK